MDEANEEDRTVELEPDMNSLLAQVAVADSLAISWRLRSLSRFLDIIIGRARAQVVSLPKAGTRVYTTLVLSK